MTRFIPFPGPRVAGMLALAIVLLTLGAAVLGTAAGAHVAAEAAPAAEPLGDVAPARPKPAVHSVIGRVVGTRDEFVMVRPPGAEPVRVHLLPRTLVRRAGERVEPSSIQRGDRVLVVGRLNENNVLQARAIVIRPRPSPAAVGEDAEGGPGSRPPRDWASSAQPKPGSARGDAARRSRPVAPAGGDEGPPGAAGSPAPE